MSVQLEPLVLQQELHQHPGLEQDRIRKDLLFIIFPTAEILQANDSLTHVINLYKQQVKGEIVNGNRPKQSGGCPRRRWPRRLVFGMTRTESVPHRRRDGAAGPVWIGHIAAVATLVPRVSHPHRQPDCPLPRGRNQPP